MKSCLVLWVCIQFCFLQQGVLLVYPSPVQPQRRSLTIWVTVSVQFACMARVGILFCVSDQFLTWTKFPGVFFLGADTFQALCVDSNSRSRLTAAFWGHKVNHFRRGACLNVFWKQQGIWTLLAEKAISPTEWRGLHKRTYSSSRSFLHSLCWSCSCSNVPHSCSYASVEVSSCTIVLRLCIQVSQFRSPFKWLFLKHLEVYKMVRCLCCYLTIVYWIR